MVSDFPLLSWELLSSWLITYWLHSTIGLGGLAIVLHFTRVETFVVARVVLARGDATWIRHSHAGVNT